MTTAHASPFGVLLRRHRLAAGLTQEELVERAGISLRGLVALENGERVRPRRDTVRLLADALLLGEDARFQFEAVSRGRDASGAQELIRPLDRTAIRGAGPASKSRQRGMTPLIGRARELELLERHLAGHGPPVVMFAGEPGIGKTRLLQRAIDVAGSRGQAVVAGGCQRRSGQQPYAPFPHAIARFFAGLSVPTRELLVRQNRWLVRLLPELAPILPEPLGPTSLEAGQERRLLFDAIARLLANLVGDKGALLVLDDLQWAPLDALDLLAALSHEATHAGFRVLGAYRTTELRPADPLSVTLADLAHAGLVRQAPVKPLSTSESEELLHAVAGGRRAPGELTRRVVTRTGGVPYYLVSYGQELRTGDEVPDTDVPWDVAHSVRQRAAALPEASREILGLAAIAGRTVSLDVLERAMGLNAEDLLPGVEAICRERLLEETGGRAYRFPHDVVREAIEADLGAARRSVLHRRLGEALLRTDSRATGAAELAWHFVEGGDAQRALQYSLLAGDEAAAVFAHEEAERHYRTALDLAGRTGDCAGQIEALQQLGSVLYNAGQLDEALAMLEDAAALATTAGDAIGEARAVAQVGRTQERRGAIAEGIARVEPLLLRFEHAEDTNSAHHVAHARLLLALGDLYFEAGRYPDELQAAERAVELGQRLGENHLITDGARQRGLALMSLGRASEAMGVWAAALPLMEATGDLYNLSHTLNNLAMASSDFREAARYVERALETAEQLGDPGHIVFMTCNLASLEFSAGRWDEARSLARRGWDLGGAGGERGFGYPALILGEIDLAEGNIAASRRWLETCVSIATDSDLGMLRRAKRLLAEIDLIEGHPDGALARLDPLLDRPGLEEEGVTVLLPTLARAHLNSDYPKRAEEVAREGLRRAEALGYQDLIGELLAVTGAIAACNRQWDEAAAAFDEALTVSRRRQFPYVEGRVLYEYGLMESRRGRLKRARALLAEALLIFRRLGARPYQVHAQSALQDLTMETRRA